mmetsp:Transcript_14289/g.31291  ORF Transcript_14289/g.31291 Transcript_14289/m.31291 type:complete len:403 (-) Transcript_14289:155-1363(-)
MHEPGERHPHAVVQTFGKPEVQQHGHGSVAIHRSGHEDVPCVRVGVEEPSDVHLRRPSLAYPSQQQPPVRPGLFHRRHVPYREAGAVFHRQHPLRHQTRRGPGHHRRVPSLPQETANLEHVRRLRPEVELPLHLAGVLVAHGPEVQIGVGAGQERQDDAEGGHVLPHQRCHAAVLHLDHDLPSVERLLPSVRFRSAQDGPVDLRQARGRERRRIDPRKDVVLPPLELLAQRAPHVAEGHGGDVVLQRRQRVHVRAGHHVRPGGEVLADLDPEPAEGTDAVPETGSVADVGLLPQRGEQGMVGGVVGVGTGGEAESAAEAAFPTFDVFVAQVDATGEKEDAGAATKAGPDGGIGGGRGRRGRRGGTGRIRGGGRRGRLYGGGGGGGGEAEDGDVAAPKGGEQY